MGLDGQTDHATASPGFNELCYGYRSFKKLIEDAQKHKLVVLVRDEKSGQHTIRLPAGLILADFGQSLRQCLERQLRRRPFYALIATKKVFVTAINPHFSIDTNRPVPVKFVPLADPPEVHPIATHGVRLTAESPEQDGWRKEIFRNDGKHCRQHDLF